MAEMSLKFQSPTGLHARPAAALAAEAKKFSSKIQIRSGDCGADVKSVMGLMSLGLKGETDVLLTAEGPDAEEAVAFLAKFIDSEIFGK